MFTENINHLEKLRIPGLRFRVFSKPDAAQRILLTKHQLYGRCALVFDRIRPLTGADGLVQLSDQKWGQLRQCYARMFSGERLEALAQEFRDKAHLLLSRTAAGYPAGGADVDILPVINHYVLDNALQLFAGSGFDDADELPHYFLELNRLCGESMLKPVNLNPLSRIRIRALEKKLNAAVGTLLGRTPLLNRFTAEDPALLLDQVKTFLFAGHETTTSSIVSAVWLLARHPGHQTEFHRLPEEQRPQFLRNVYNEALRLYPPAWILVRTAYADDNELAVRKGDHVIVSVRAIHRDPAYWHDPDVFLPDRHDEPYAHPTQFIPYGAGPKKCIGATLAPVEAVQFLTPLLERFRLSTTAELRMKAHITLFPDGPVKIALEARQ